MSYTCSCKWTNK